MPAPLGEHLPVVAVDRDDLAIRPVGDENIFLCGVFRQHKIPNRTVLQSFLLDPELIEEGVVFSEHLDAIISAVADIHEIVIRYSHAMHWIGELLREWTIGRVGWHLV